MDNRMYWMWLTAMSGITNGDITALFERFDSIDDIYSAKDFGGISGIKPLARLKLKDKSLKKAEAMLKYSKEKDIKILTYDSPEFPDSLRCISDPPYVLYLRGEVMQWDRLLAVSVVGTRNCTDYGIAAADKLCFALAENGVTIVSGMARGIDTEASKSAIRAGNKTIAVMGCWVDIVYPPENAHLMNKIIENGAVISEYPPGTPPKPMHFPRRNRIISGLSRGILVIEAPEKSGALITARFGLENGKDIFAVPGSIFKSSCAGTNRLIAHGAKAVSEARDILEEYVYDIERLGIKKPDAVQHKIKKTPKNKVNNVLKITPDDKKYANLSEDERQIIMLLIESNLHIDDIKRKSGFEIGKLTTILSMLEFGGFIQKIPGNNYRLNI